MPTQAFLLPPALVLEVLVGNSRGLRNTLTIRMISKGISVYNSAYFNYYY